MRTEVELKYAAEPAALDELARTDALGPASLGTLTTTDELDRYLDTDDGRLAAAAWACRLRRRGVGAAATTIVSLKGPAVAVEGPLHRRPEVEGPATDHPDPAAWPASAARDLLDELRGGRPVAEQLALAQERREREVTVDRRRIATLSLDAARILREGAELGRLDVVELELAAGADERLLGPLAEALAAIPGLRPDGRSKLERALAMRDAAPGVPR